MRLLEEQVTCVDRIGEIGDRASEGQAAGMYGEVLRQGFWQRKEPGVG